MESLLDFLYAVSALSIVIFGIMWSIREMIKYIKGKEDENRDNE